MAFKIDILQLKICLYCRVTCWYQDYGVESVYIAILLTLLCVIKFFFFNIRLYFILHCNTKYTVDYSMQLQNNVKLLNYMIYFFDNLAKSSIINQFINCCDS